MLKPTLVALATIIGATAALPSVASAIDNGPCDHCTMDPIVVKGDRKKTKTRKPATQQIGTNGLQIWLGK
jgi:hypothetical protein